MTRIVDPPLRIPQVKYYPRVNSCLLPSIRIVDPPLKISNLTMTTLFVILFCSCFKDYETAIYFGWKYTSGAKDAIEYDDVALWDRHIEENEMKRIYEVNF